MTGTLRHMFVLVAATNFAVLATAETDYCNITTCTIPSQHSMCMYKCMLVMLRTDIQNLLSLLRLRPQRTQPVRIRLFQNCSRLNEIEIFGSSHCRDAISTGLTQQDISDIVNMHNSLRRYVASGAEEDGNPGGQPAASQFQLLRWDGELAEIAQNWAKQCNFGHDQCRDSSRFKVGQNIGVLSSSTDASPYSIKFTDIVRTWYDEVDKFDRNQVKFFNDSNIAGDYTQMMWADTKLLGCGGIRERDSQSRIFTAFLVCNYGPAGNIIGGEVYKTR